MKKLLIVAVALASVNAFATRARTTALSNSPHLVDTTTVYTNPAHIFGLGGDYVTIESGNTVATNTTDGAEGMVVRSHGDAKFGVSLGHDSDNAILLRNATGVPAALGNNANVLSQQNPLELTYGAKAGDITWAGTFIYSNYKDKTATDAKEDTMGLRAGMTMGALDASLRLGLANNASVGNNKFKGTTGIGLGVGYWMDSIYFHGDVAMAGFKLEVGGTEAAKFDRTTIALSATSEMKKDNNSFFYGAGLAKVDSKESVADSKTSTLSLPVWMGLEVAANSWLTVRGSISQTVLINDEKTETAGTTTTDLSPGANNTEAAMGVGLKLDKLTLDGTLKGLVGGAQNQQLDGDDLLAQVGATYMF